MLRVTEKLFRGPRPSDLRELIDRQFQQVIVTQSGDEDFLTDSLYEHQLRTKKADPSIYPQIDVAYIRCSNIFPPDAERVTRFLDTLSNGKRTYLHCHSGVDRTGFLVATYRMVEQKWPYHEAYKEWVESGRHFWFDWWKKELKKYA